jgi:hypothetical protein
MISCRAVLLVRRSALARCETELHRWYEKKEGLGLGVAELLEAYSGRE